VSGNHTDGSVFGGGGIMNFAGEVAMDHTTVSGNHADGSRRGGGGIFNAYGGTLALAYSTVCDNSAPLGADLFNSGSTVTLDHSVVCVRFDDGERPGR